MSDLTRPGTGVAGGPASGFAAYDQDRPMTTYNRPTTGEFEDMGMEGFSGRPMTGVTGSRPVSGYPGSPVDRPMTGVAGSQPVSGYARPGQERPPTMASRPASGYPGSPVDRPITGVAGSRPASGYPGSPADRPMTGAAGSRPASGGQGYGHERPSTGHQFPVDDDDDFPAHSERPMTTVSASRPMTMAGRSSASQPAETWDEPAGGQAQWDEPLADRRPPAASRPVSGLYDRPKTAGGHSGPMSGLVDRPDDLSGRPSTSAMRPTPDPDRPQTGASRSRPATGAAESRSLGGSRPMTGLSRPATGFQSHSAGASRPMTSASRPASGAPGHDGRSFSEHTSWENRPGTSGRPFTGAVAGGAAGFRPGTQAPASRAGPMSRMGSGRPVTGTLEKIRVMSRPITQQGLSGMKTAGSGRSRMVQDKSYFMALLRTKTSELRSEVQKLRRQADSLDQEQATYTTYDTRVKEMAGELLEHQAELADYNVLVELMNMDSDRSLVDTEFEDLKYRNGREALLVEKLFLSRKEKENEIHAIESQMEQERRLADTLVESMPTEVRDRYVALRERNAQLQADIEQQQQQVDELSVRKSELDTELAASPLKQEAAVLYDKLTYLESKKTELLEEKNLRETPEQERERLLKQVKSNNQEMGTLERRIFELKAEIQTAHEELQITENDLEDSNSDRNMKYRELRKREQEMQAFLESYAESKASETGAVKQAETEVLRTLEAIGRSLGHARHLPSFTSKDLGELRESLTVKEGETAKSRNTLTDLGTKHQQLQANHEKIEALDEKVREEMKTLREKMTKMREEIVIFSDLPSLKQQNDEKTTKLSIERVDCQNRQLATRQQLMEFDLEYKAVKGELEAMDPYIQLGILERRLASIEQNNHSLFEFVATKRAEVDYGDVRGQVMHTIYESNKRLMEDAIAGRAAF